jgi:hypothetical protein
MATPPRIALRWFQCSEEEKEDDDEKAVDRGWILVADPSRVSSLMAKKVIEVHATSFAYGPELLPEPMQNSCGI